jgi:hypothetical protein
MAKIKDFNKRSEMSESREQKRIFGSKPEV